MKKVLIIDDDSDSLGLLSEMLKDHFLTRTASSGKEGVRTAVREQPHLILLDVNMPEMNGFEVCMRLREQPTTRTIPIVMLTTSSGLDSRVTGLNLGADDYICKPFHVRELVARLRARLRRREMEQRETGELEVGNLVLEPKACRVRINRKEVALTQTEYELLRYFLERPDQVINRKKLLSDLWPDAVVSVRTVDTHIANLRKKISGFNCSLTTVYRAGYLLKTS